MLHLTNAAALAECAVLAGLLTVWADRVAGAGLLILFLGTVCCWLAGNELPTWFGPRAAPAGLALLGAAPFGAAVFCLFAVRWLGLAWPRWAGRALLALGAGIGLGVAWAGPGTFRLLPGLGYVAAPNAVGWAASLAWAGLALAGHGILLRGWLRGDGPARARIAAVGVSSAIGLFCMAGYGLPALDTRLPPLPLLALPAYPLSLVYAILRYRVLIANAWAQRALAWSLLTILAVLAIALVAALPLGGGAAGRLVSGGLVALGALALAGPARALAARLVYPGGVAEAADFLTWRRELGGAASFAELEDRAERLLSRRLATAVHVAFGEAAAAPALCCRDGPDGWAVELVGWEAAPPGPRRLAELFGTVLADEAARLARAQGLAARERERQTQARLAELGALAATVAHDVRNPLNIIAMAAAGMDPALRADIDEQVARIARLTADLLDYAKPWGLALEEFDLAALLRALAGRWENVELGPGLAGAVILRADAHRLEQAVVNLLDNAVRAGSRCEIDLERREDEMRIFVSDDGPGLDEEVKTRLFEPFVSRSPGGTGLGLAIVARVMAAHGGAVALADRPGWTTSFTLSLPR